MNTENKIINLAEIFFKEVYPNLGQPDLYEIYMEKYYKPNEQILDAHNSKWKQYSRDELKDMVTHWRKSDFERANEKYNELNMAKIRETLSLINKKLGIDDIELYILVGNGLYHECFHIYHFKALDKLGYQYKDDFIETIVADGRADYFTYLHFKELPTHILLSLSEEDAKMIAANEQEYWQKILKSMKDDAPEMTIIKFNLPVEARAKFGFENENYPGRISYYYGLKMIKSLVDLNHDFFYELIHLEPKSVFEMCIEKNFKKKCVT